MAQHKIEVWSDIACPFCYLGKKRLDQVLLAFGRKDDFEVVMKSFLLNPVLVTDTSISLMQYLSREKGWDAGSVSKINAQINASGAELGLDFRFDKVVVANTRRAHRFLKAVGDSDNQDSIADKLFKAYFTDGLNVDDDTVLQALLGEAGIKSIDFTATDAAVQADLDEAAAIGVSAVPFFVFDRKFAVRGAQPAEVFQQALERVTS